MNEHERDFLLASAELVRREQELVPLLAHHLGVQPNEVYYLWMGAFGKDRADLPQLGDITGTDWRYWFHGLECDLMHRREGYYVRVDFGPHGRVDTFTGWGVLQYIMSSSPPWKVFPALQAYLARESPPYTPLSGSYQKMCVLQDRLQELGMFEPADITLQNLVELHTESHGRETIFRLPPDLDERKILDSYVCSNLTLSDSAWTLLESLPGESSQKPENMA